MRELPENGLDVTHQQHTLSHTSCLISKPMPSFQLLTLACTTCTHAHMHTRTCTRTHTHTHTHTLAGYSVGLLATLLALALMRQAQPALLYLVPTTLGSVTVLALVRREFVLFFTGKVSPCVGRVRHTH